MDREAGFQTRQHVLKVSLSNHCRKATSDVVTRKDACVEKSRHRTHCGVLKRSERLSERRRKEEIV